MPADFICKNIGELVDGSFKIDAVFITHAHTDHLSPNALTFLCQNNIPIYTHAKVWDDICRKFGKKAHKCNEKIFEGGFYFKDMEVSPFSVYHKDNAVSQTIGYAFRADVAGRVYKIGYATDIGQMTDGVKKALQNCNILAIEANYDRGLLDMSFRPRKNKKWITSGWGHLENNQAGQAICDIKKNSTAKDSLKHVFLSHLSKDHNNPHMAVKTIGGMLNEHKISDVNLLIARRAMRSKSITIL
jgi:phosphoribosyl 1,2-cyclic phosphodiesterase